MKGTTAVIVLNYNDYFQTIQFVKHIERYTSIQYIIVVDNASLNNSYEKLCNLKNDKVYVIKSKRNLGYARGNNLGMKYGVRQFDPEYFVIANPDVFFEEKAVTAIIELLKKDTSIGMAAPRMVSHGGTRTLPAWKLPGKREMYLNNFMLLRKCLRLLEYQKSCFKKKICEVDVLPGSLLFCRTEVMREVGYFDKDTFLYGEENILAFKMKEKGYRNILMTQIHYDHLHGKTIQKEITSVRKRFYLCLQGYKVYTRKYLKMNWMETMVFSFTFCLGVWNYLVLIGIKNCVDRFL